MRRQGLSNRHLGVCYGIRFLGCNLRFNEVNSSFSVHKNVLFGVIKAPADLLFHHAGWDTICSTVEGNDFQKNFRGVKYKIMSIKQEKYN